MNKEEQEAIEYIKELIKPPLREEWDFAYKLDKTTAKQFKVLVKCIDKLLKELKCEKELRIRYERRYDKCKESEDRLKFKNTELKKELNYYKEDERNWE